MRYCAVRGRIGVVAANEYRCLCTDRPVNVLRCVNRLLDILSVEINVPAWREEHPRVRKPKNIVWHWENLSNLVNIEAWIDVEDGPGDQMKDIAVWQVICTMGVDSGTLATIWLFSRWGECQILVDVFVVATFFRGVGNQCNSRVIEGQDLRKN